MKRKIKSCLLLCFLLMLMFAGCGKNRTDVREGDAYIFCLNGDQTGLTKLKYDITEKEPLVAAEQILKELSKQSENIDYTAPLPENITINEIRLEGGLLYLDLSKEYNELTPIEEKLARAALVKSLVKIDGISGIWFTVNGAELCDSEGRVHGVMTADDFVQITSSSLSSYQTATLTLYFANEAGDKLIARTLDAKYNSNMSKEKLIVEKLVKGPKKNTGYPTINPNATILGVTIKDGICYVNFDDEFLNSDFDVKPEITIYSIVNSLVENTVASKVQITVSGEKKIKYRETVDLTHPIQSEMSWVGSEEE